MSRYIRPVGHRIIAEALERQDARGAPVFTAYKPCYVNSGTAALQLAMQIAQRCSGVSDLDPKDESRIGEVIIPAYGCPDLITACQGAKLKPVIIDSEHEGTPFPSARQYANAITSNTVAILAVNLFGLLSPISSEQWGSLRDAGGRHIVEDRAQAYPFPSEQEVLFGDMVITSFGKGKPVSLLGGGMLLVSRELDAECEFNTYNPHTISRFEQMKIKAKIAAYNTVIHPAVYGMLLKVPGLNIGATSYKPPIPIVPLDQTRVSWLPENAYRLESMFELAAHCERLTGLVSECRALDLVGTAPGEATDNSLYQVKRLLRFPVLARNKAERDRLLQQFQLQGCGATDMYKSAIPDMLDVPLSEDQIAKDFSNARAFADRLFTLPSHEDVDEICYDALQAALTALG